MRDSVKATNKKIIAVWNNSDKIRKNFNYKQFNNGIT